MTSIAKVTEQTTAKLFKGNPSSVMAIRQVTPNIVTFSVPFLRFGLIKFGGRGTLARLNSGSLAIFSPVALSPEVRAEVDKMGGNVSYIIAPDMEHHLYLGAWKAAFPNANVIAPDGLYQKRQKQGNEDVHVDYAFTRENKRELSSSLPEDFRSTFDLEFFDGHASREVVLLHRQDRTLIQADLMFNLPAKEQYSKTDEDATSGFITKFFSYFTNTAGDMKGQQRFINYAMAKDKGSFAASSRIVAAWNFEKIIPCHGDVIEKDANDVFRKLFAWHIGKEKL